jgi:ABC-type nitrate/sulfonate/bicarbonate transport system substrate-binding protein
MTFPIPNLLRLPLLLLVLVASVSLLAACGGDDGDEFTVQLDWTPNTNHIGIYVALAEGWYEDEGLDVKIQPYSDISPDVVVANGQADVGISFPQSVIFSRAAGLDIVSVAAVLQRTVSEFAVLDSSDIRRPRDFDGRLYAGFGAPYEEPQIKTVIRADGGAGEFQTAVLSTAAYEALYNKRADFTEIFTAWEGVEAEMRGIKLRTFRYSDYGVPDIYSVVLTARNEDVAAKAEAYRKFLEVTQRGYEFAAQNPAQAAEIFLDYLPEGTFPEPDMVRRSAALLAPVFVSGSNRWGVQEESKWRSYINWLVGSGVVTDANGRVVSQLPGGPLFTSQFLTSQSRAPQ